MTIKSKTAPIIIDKRERAVQALELRKAGISYEMIAQRLNYSNRTAAYRAVSRLLDSTEKEAVQDLREMELRRLDDLFMSIYTDARKGNLGAVDRCLRIMERRAKIAGIDSPEKTQTDIRQVIKVVYEDVQFADDFEDAEPAQIPMDGKLLTMPSPNVYYEEEEGEEEVEYADEEERSDEDTNNV